MLFQSASLMKKFEVNNRAEAIKQAIDYLRGRLKDNGNPNTIQLENGDYRWEASDGTAFIIRVQSGNVKLHQKFNRERLH